MPVLTHRNIRPDGESGAHASGRSGRDEVRPGVPARAAYVRCPRCGALFLCGVWGFPTIHSHDCEKP